MVELYSYKIAGEQLVVSYSDGISEYIDEVIDIEDLYEWVKSTDKLVRNSTIINDGKQMEFPISFNDYIRSFLNWTDVTEFLQDRIK